MKTTGKSEQMALNRVVALFCNFYTVHAGLTAFAPRREQARIH